jgi:preprotein translocase subunit SecG
MYTLLLVLLIIVSLVVVAAVLLQSGKGGGLAASFGGSSSGADAFIGNRQAGNLLTKLSWWGGGVFLGLAFLLQLMSVRTRAPKSVLDAPLTQTPAPVTAPPAAKQGTVPAIPLEGTPPATTPTPPAPKKK